MSTVSKPASQGMVTPRIVITDTDSTVHSLGIEGIIKPRIVITDTDSTVSNLPSKSMANPRIVITDANCVDVATYIFEHDRPVVDTVYYSKRKHRESEIRPHPGVPSDGGSSREYRTASWVHDLNNGSESQQIRERTDHEVNGNGHRPSSHSGASSKVANGNVKADRDGCQKKGDGAKDRESSDGSKGTDKEKKRSKRKSITEKFKILRPSKSDDDDDDPNGAGGGKQESFCMGRHNSYPGTAKELDLGQKKYGKCGPGPFRR
jgi:hypothetical protein